MLPLVYYFSLRLIIDSLLCASIVLHKLTRTIGGAPFYTANRRPTVRGEPSEESQSYRHLLIKDSFAGMH